MIVELLDDAVPPWLGRWNEPEMDPVAQAEPDKRPHAPWVGRASVEGQLIVRLKVLGNPHTQPDRINSLQNALCRFRGQRLYSAPVDRGIDGMKTVEPDGAGKVTGTDQINLMGLIGQKRRKLGIFLALGLIPPGPPMSQFAPPQDTADRAKGGNGLNLHVDQFPLNGLVSAETIIVVQVQPNHFHDLFYLGRGAVGTGERSPRLIVAPRRIIGGIPRHPFIEPWLRLPQ